MAHEPRRPAFPYSQRVACFAYVPGADIVDVHFFAGVQTTLAFEARPASGRALGKALTEAGLELDEGSIAVLESAASATEELEGTLSITFPEGESDLRRDVPSVPG